MCAAPEMRCATCERRQGPVGPGPPRPVAWVHRRRCGFLRVPGGLLDWLAGLSARCEPVLRAESGNGLLELFADFVEAVRFGSVDGCTDRGDQTAVGCQQGGGYGKRVAERDSAVKGESARADLGEFGEELSNL